MNSIIGFYIHHQPKTKSVSTSAITNFVIAYKKQFDDLISFWYDTLSEKMHLVVTGKLNHQAVSEEKWSGWTGRIENNHTY